VLRKALDEYKVVGVSTNVEFLRTLAGNEAFIRGDVETGFIPVSICSPPNRCLVSFFDLRRNTSTTCSRQFPHQRRKRLHRPLCTLSFETIPSLPRLLHPGPPSLLADSAETFMIAWSPYNRGRVPDLYRPGQVHFPRHLRYHCERHYGIHLRPCASRLQGRGFQFRGWQEPTDDRRLATSTSLTPGVLLSEHDGAVTCLPGRAEVYVGPSDAEVAVIPWWRCVGRG
jgi:hypothetical protein